MNKTRKLTALAAAMRRLPCCWPARGQRFQQRWSATEPPAGIDLSYTGDLPSRRSPSVTTTTRAVTTYRHTPTLSIVESARTGTTCLPTATPATCPSCDSSQPP
ncbi:MAG: hypothetical protein ACLS6O_01940 [Bifidobacterium sp.]